MGYLKIYLNIWILKKKNFFRWVGEPTHLTHQPVVGWAGLQNFWLTRKWVELGSVIFNPTRGEPTRVSRVGSLWHVYRQATHMFWPNSRFLKRNRLAVSSRPPGDAWLLTQFSRFWLNCLPMMNTRQATWVNPTRFVCFSHSGMILFGGKVSFNY